VCVCVCVCVCVYIYSTESISSAVVAVLNKEYEGCVLIVKKARVNPRHLSS